MMKGLIGKKLGMTQVFSEDGRKIPVTVVELGPCVITQIKNKAKDGYNAIQLGFGQVDSASAKRPILGHCKVSGEGAKRFFREIRMDVTDAYKVGDTITAGIFEPGDYVDVTGVSIGKGYQGVIKRWGFQGGRSTHGSRFHRAPGSIGCSATPSRVLKNKKMPGQMGNEKVTVQRLQVVRVDEADGIMLLKGAVPGSRNSLVVVKGSVKA